LHELGERLQVPAHSSNAVENDAEFLERVRDKIA